MEQPTIGRVVRYVDADGGERAAIVGEVALSGLTLAVLRTSLGSSGWFIERNVQGDEAGANGTWHWPERS